MQLWENLDQKRKGVDRRTWSLAAEFKSSFRSPRLLELSEIWCAVTHRDG